MNFQFNQAIELLSKTLDLINPRLMGHHRRVAYTAYKLAKTLDLGSESVHHTTVAALLHDIGALNNKELPKMTNFDDLDNMSHPTMGFYLLDSVPLFKKIAPIVLYHHTYYKDIVKDNHLIKEVPLESYILCLACRL